MEESRAELRKLIQKVVIYPTPPFKPYEVEINGFLIAINSKAPEGGAAHFIAPAAMRGHSSI